MLFQLVSCYRPNISVITIFSKFMQNIHSHLVSYSNSAFTTIEAFHVYNFFCCIFKSSTIKYFVLYLILQISDIKFKISTGFMKIYLFSNDILPCLQNGRLFSFFQCFIGQLKHYYY